MKEVLTFYRALDPVKGSWDSYGFFPIGNDDFLAFVADAPSGASIQTPEIIKAFWKAFCSRLEDSGLDHIELADAINRLQQELLNKARQEGHIYQSTIVVVRKVGDRLIYRCVGDSVLQLFRAGRFYRLAEEEVWDGSLILKPDNRSAERQKTTETRFIGSNGSFVESSSIRELQLNHEDVLLLYTDGVEDTLTPDRILSWLNGAKLEPARHLEAAFAPGKLKDDVTLLAVPVRVAAVFNAEKEFHALRSEVESLHQEQTRLRNDPAHAALEAKLGHMDATLQQIKKELHDISRRPGENPRLAPGRSFTVARTRNISPWIVGAVLLLAGFLMSAILFLRQPVEPIPPVVVKPRPVARTAPPEIPGSQNCNYTVQKGDSFEKIAAGKQITVEQILKWNPKHSKETTLMPGQSLYVCEAKE